MQARHCLHIPVAIALLGAGPGSNGAALLPVVAKDPSVPQVVSTKIEELLQEAMSGEVSLSGAQVQALAKESVQGEPEVVLGARKKLADARQAYMNVELDKAAVSASLAETSLRSQMEELRNEDFPLLLEAISQKALALQTNGKNREADQALDSLVELRPTYKLDEANYPPAMQEALSRAAQRLDSKPRGTVKVTSMPGFASVFLNGVRMGETPTTLKSLPTGDQLIRVEAEGHLPQAKRVQVKPEVQTVTFILKPDSAARELNALLDDLKTDKERAQIVTRSRAVAQALGMEALVLVEVTKAGGEYLVSAAHVPQAGEAPTVAWGTVDSDLAGGPALAQEIAATLRAKGLPTRVGTSRVEPTEPLDFEKYLLGIPAPMTLEMKQDAEAKKPKSILTRWWFWTAVGVVAVGAGAGAYAATRPAKVVQQPNRIDLVVDTK